jgi:L-threonylcarbamoyladenylate synthase
MSAGAARLISTDVELAAHRLRSGGLVAIPTETVYGLAADASNVDAVARIFATKGRPSDHPLILHVASSECLDGWVAGMTEPAVRLAATCWPGPLTMLVPRGPRTPHIVTGGRETVGVRVPHHPMTTELLRRFDGGVAAPSANRFGKVSPTTARHVLDDLGDWLDPDRDLILDGGACPVGVESTIVDLTVEPPQVLRTGAISATDIERLLRQPVGAAGGPSRASGMLASHYAPNCRIVLAERAEDALHVARMSAAAGERVDVLDRTADVVEAAQLLYDDLRSADRRHLDALIVVLPDAEGIGLAVRDRLMKAAADRPDSTSRAG